MTAAEPDSSPAARRKWRGVEPDARTAQRRTRIIAAAIELLATEGLSGTTVRAVCARSGLHSRYFYESFASIDALLLAVFDRLADEFVGHVTAAADRAGDEPRDRVRAVMEATLEVFEQQAHLVRVLTVEAVGNEELNRRRIDMLHRLAGMVEEDAKRTYGARGRAARITAVGARFLAGGIAELLLAWLDGELQGTPAQLADDATEVVLAFGEATRRAAGGERRDPVPPS